MSRQGSIGKGGKTNYMINEEEDMPGGEISKGGRWMGDDNEEKDIPLLRGAVLRTPWPPPSPL